MLTDINNSKFPLRYKPRRQAVVLEAIKPDIACRRILATGDASMSNLKEGFSMRLNSLPLGSFEVDWYGSLLTDRLRRVDALYDIGIVHGDIEDHHFRLPGEFYDIVLYDFLYHIHFLQRCLYLISARNPRPLSVIKKHEKRQVEDQIYARYVATYNHWKGY